MDLACERDLEHRDDDQVPFDIIDARQTITASVVRRQHKFCGLEYVFKSIAKQLACRPIERTDSAEFERQWVEANARATIGCASDRRAGPVRLVRDDL